MSRKKREPVDPEHLKPEDRMKFEIATVSYTHLTLPTKKKREMSAKAQDKENPGENCH